MDITSVFGTAVPGSNPGGGTKIKHAPEKVHVFNFCSLRQDSNGGGCEADSEVKEES